jgi:hypothetical protein
MAKAKLAKSKTFAAKEPSFNFGANKKPAKGNGSKKTGPRMGKGPGGFPMQYGS